MEPGVRRRYVARVPSIETCYPPMETFSTGPDDEYPRDPTVALLSPVPESTITEGTTAVNGTAPHNSMEVLGQHANMGITAAHHGIVESTSIHSFSAVPSSSKLSTAPKNSMQAQNQSGTVISYQQNSATTSSLPPTRPRENLTASQVPKQDGTIEIVSQQMTTPDYLLSKEMKKEYINVYVPLYHAAIKGDWKAAEGVISKHPTIVRERIARGHETALHIATAAGQTKFVEELVKRMNSDELALQNDDGNTAFCFAMASGSTAIAEAMVNKNNNLPSKRGSKGVTPLYMAALFGNRKMVQYVYDKTRSEDLTPEDRIAILIAAINSSLFGIAIKMLEEHPELAIPRYEKRDMAQGQTIETGKGETALHVLAQMPEAFANPNEIQFWRRIFNLVPGIKFFNNKMWIKIEAHKLAENIWKEVIKLDDKDVSDLIRQPSRLLFVAAELGNIGFITLLIKHYPDLIWRVDNNYNKRSIFHVAVAHRQENVFSLIYEIGAIKDLIASYKDESHNNMLHLAATLPPRQLKTVPGAALQMQRELLWFKEVEKVVPPSYIKMENSNGKTPRDLFSAQHKDLLKEAEKWMRNTSTSCMLVATLIATVVFGVASIIPGGNKDGTGIPTFLTTKPFKAFGISDAIALFSSTTSVLMFLSILTSRYAEEDFLTILPIKLILGLTTLFISIVSMMITFGASIFIILNQDFKRVVIPIALFASVPVILFALLQFPLLIDIIYSTYRASILYRRKKHWIY